MAGIKASIARSNIYYRVDFARPVFKHISTFPRIIEPIYDAFCQEIPQFAEMIQLNSGNTVATNSVVVTLSSEKNLLQATLSGYDTHFCDLRSNEIIQAKRFSKNFEEAVSSFLEEGEPAKWQLIHSIWIALESKNAHHETNRILNLFSRDSQGNVPFGIGTIETCSQVSFNCLNEDDKWRVGIQLEQSAFRDSNLFLQMSVQYKTGVQFDTFERKFDHLSQATETVTDKLGLTLDEN